jgi:hypothetical protein
VPRNEHNIPSNGYHQPPKKKLLSLLEWGIKGMVVGVKYKKHFGLAYIPRRQRAYSIYLMHFGGKESFSLLFFSVIL